MGDITITVNAIQGIPVSSTPPTAGQVLQFNGTEYVPATLPFINPQSISGLQLWLRSDIGITLSGSEVVSWMDQSGTGDINKNMNGGGSALNPTINSSDADYNSYPSVNFLQSSSQYMLSVGNWSIPLGQPFTVFIVGNDDGNTSNNQCYFSNTASTNPSMFVYSPSGPFVYLMEASSICYTAIQPTGDPEVFRMEYNSPNSTMSISTATPNISSQNTGSTTLGTNGFVLGAYNNDTACLNGKLVEVIVYDNILSSVEVAQVQNYLSARYSISIGP